jgi:hypothetical protein
VKLSRTATARFASVVEVAGKPQLVSLWTKPERDKHFMGAVRQNRVMTLKQENVGSAKDFGVVGFLREKNVSYLVFPKSLKDFKDRRIVGVKYDLIQTPGPIGRVIKPGAAAKGRPRRHVRPAEWEAALPMPTTEAPAAKHQKRFNVTIRFTATAEIVQNVVADSKTEAKKAALQEVVLPDLRQGTITRKVVKVNAGD